MKSKLMLMAALIALVSMGFAQGEGQQGNRANRQREGIGAQPPGGGRGGQFGQGGMGGQLINRPDVQKELKITEDQLSRMQKLREGQRARMQDFANLSPEERREAMQKAQEQNRKEQDAILTESQRNRLKELELQAQGPMALLRPEIAKELNITTEQQSKIRGVQDEMREQAMESFRGGRQEGGREEMMKMMDEMRAKAEQRVLAVLTSAQKDQWTKMQGVPFKWEGGRPMMGGGMMGGPGGRGGAGRPPLN